MIQIRDVASLNMKAWEYADCYTGELTADHGEFYLSCDGNSLACTTLDPAYYGGTAYCNSTCDGYNENSCETDDGWQVQQSCSEL